MTFGVDILANILAAVLYDGGKIGIQFLRDKLRDSEFEQMVDSAIESVARDIKAPPEVVRVALIEFLSQQDDLRAELNTVVIIDSQLTVENALTEYQLRHAQYRVSSIDQNIIANRFFIALRNIIAANAEPAEKQIMMDLDEVRRNQQILRDRLDLEDLARSGLLKAVLLGLALNENWNSMSVNQRRGRIRQLIAYAGLEPRKDLVQLCENVMSSGIRDANIMLRNAKKHNPSVQQFVNSISSMSEASMLNETLGEYRTEQLSVIP